jgi:hypothetical protein
MIDIYHHVSESLLEARQYDGEVIYDDGHSAPVDRKEVVNVAKESAGGLDFSQKSRNVVIELEFRCTSNSEELRGNTIAPYGLPPTPFNGPIHPYADIKSMRLGKQHRALMFWRQLQKSGERM